MLTTLPLPFAAIFGAKAATRKYGADVADEQGVERGHVKVRGRAEPREPGVVHQHVNLRDVVDQALQRREVGNIGRDETRAPTCGGDHVHRLGATGGVTPVDDHFGALSRQLNGDGAADAGRRPRDEGSLVLQVPHGVLLGCGHLHAPHIRARLFNNR